MILQVYTWDDHDNPIYTSINETHWLPRNGDYISMNDIKVPTHVVVSITHILKSNNIIVIVKPYIPSDERCNCTLKEDGGTGCMFWLNPGKKCQVEGKIKKK